MKDLASIKSKFLEFGVQLGVSMDNIDSFKVDHNHDSGRILHQILHHWLNNTPQNVLFSKLCIALEGIERKDLVRVIEKEYIQRPQPGTADGEVEFEE